MTDQLKAQALIARLAEVVGHSSECSGAGRGDEHCDCDAVAVLADVTATLCPPAIECHGLDTPERVCFYEQDFYVLSNFSAFMVRWKGRDFATSEHVYHWEKFQGVDAIETHAALMSCLFSRSAHDVFKVAERFKAHRRPDWDDVKVHIMRDILRAKVDQQEYVRRKLLATGNRELVENSWRDGFWGWGPNRDGQNMLGKLWMEIRAELRNQDTPR